MTPSPWLGDATSLVDAFRNKTLSPREALDESLAAIADSPLNAISFLDPDQARAAVDGLGTRVQLVQGPPGTGKTTTTALAVLLRTLASGRPGDVVLVSAHTHTALDNLLSRTDRYRDAFARHAAASGRRLPAVRLAERALRK